MPPTTAATPPREVMPDVMLTKAVFLERFRSQYSDPAFGAASAELGTIAEIAWDGYINARKSPTTRRAGKGYADADYDLSVDWIAAREAINAAQKRFEAENRNARVLLINASPRSEHTCPGESSKSFRMVEIAEAVFRQAGIDTNVLDLSRLTSEYGRSIHPCKACFSTAAPLCHWPCSCYPNYSLGQTQDWMNDIYPMWVEADAVFIVTPVNWYQVSSPLKLMMDRLVCADGGNPDPTLTHGKDAEKAKAVELKGWSYPQHLAGRLFGVIVHGDVEGAENVRRSVSDWLRFMGLEAAGKKAEVDRYIGYWKPYATSHQELDADTAVQGEVKNAAQTVADAIKAKRSGTWVAAGNDLKPPRQK